METLQLKDLSMRVDKLEQQGVQDLVTLLEILSNVTFFGTLKQSNCEYAKDGQCSLFFLKAKAKDKIPIAANCRIKNCSKSLEHCHLEISNVTCTFCPQWQNSQNSKNANKQNSSRRKKPRQEK